MKIPFPPKRILVPVDMSKPSLAALEAAKSLAKRYRSKLDVIYIQEFPLSLAGFGSEVEAGSMRELVVQIADFRRWREERIKRLIGSSADGRIRVHTVQGLAPPLLANAARPRHADWVVMGTHGHTGLDRATLGSVAEAVVHRSEIPVLTIHESRVPFRLSDILAPYNLEPYADKALLYAVELARRTRTRLTVLYVGGETEWETDSRERLRRRLSILLGPKGLSRLRLLVRRGDPRKKIIREAADGRHGLIVLAAHRKNLLGDSILGSTAERILRHSPVPVLSIPSSEKELRKKLFSGKRAARAVANKIY